jgi:hypothetical protein
MERPKSAISQWLAGRFQRGRPKARVMALNASTARLLAITAIWITADELMLR